MPSSQSSSQSERKLPPDDLHVDYGAPAPGTSNPMPVEVRDAYEDRIRWSIEAQAAGARRAAHLFVGGGA
jgi:hypothetical protein